MTRRRTWAAGLALVASLAYVSPLGAEEAFRSGYVANTDGANLRMRAAPEPEAPILKRLGPGWRLTIMGGPTGDGRWLWVEHGGTSGYVAVGYIAIDTDVEEAPAVETPAPASPPPPVVDEPRPGQVVNTDGANLRLREAPSPTAMIVKRLGADWRVTVLSEVSGDGRWFKVEHGGTIGFAAAEFISTEVSAIETSPVTSAPQPVVPESQPRSGWIANTDGVNLRLRSAPSVDADVIKVLGAGWRVTILSDPFTGADGATWVRIEHGGMHGFAAAAYIAGTAAGGGEVSPAPVVTTDSTPPAPVPAAPPVAPPPPVPAPAPQPAPVARRLMTLEAARFRTEPSVNATIITRLAAGVSVEGTGREVTADGFHWLSVRTLGRDGWIVASALAPAPDQETGRRLVAEALAQVGRPYVWGGETPSAGFDCSGLVRYVVRQVTGIDLSHVLASQAEAGRLVERHELQPGDLVFFRDTYKPGLSHVGFYIGNGQFVNAQSENVGVAIARLDTSYWGTRFHSARRLTD